MNRAINFCVKDLCFSSSWEGEFLQRLDIIDGHDFPPNSETPLVARLIDELASWLEGQPVQFSIPLRPVGTDFQKRVWGELATIPWGSTITYGELAQRAGSPLAFRAVGQAMARNPIPILIPCHRVIQGSGKLGGFSLGLALKERFLTLEQVDISKRRRG